MNQMAIFRHIISFVIISILPFSLLSQVAIVSGTVRDAKTVESLIGVNVIAGNDKGVATDINGRYQLELPVGKQSLVFRYLGYREVKKEIRITAGQKLSLDVNLEVEATVIEGVVVSAGKFEQKLENVTVSMEIIKPSLINNLNPKALDGALNKVPGVNILDGQANIRNGSGYSYGTGSRVLLVVDNLPMLSPDAGDAKWNFLPLENIEQVEVLKGASSALFGSSALNGVIHVRTAFPRNEPSTTFTAYAGTYLNPNRLVLKWWDKPRFFKSTGFSHSRKIGNLDIIAGGNAFQDDSYRTENTEERYRFNSNLRWRSKKIQGLMVGLNSNLMWQDKSDFFMWQDADTAAYVQDTSTVSPSSGIRFNIDPYITWIKSENIKHSLIGRFFKVVNSFDGKSMDNKANSHYAEYQYQQKFGEKVFTAGAVLAHARGIAELFGNHSSWNQAVFAQYDARYFNRLSVSFGARWEGFKLDTSWSHSRPIFRSGINYQLARYSFLRASFGQGYRFPSIAEKYTSTFIGPLRVFPNPDLEPEKGWSAEIGWKQGLKISNWKGALDLAAFWTEYKNMMEFTFGLWDTDGNITMDDLGFKSTNVGTARITGFEVVLTGTGKLGPLTANLLLGYTYTNPIDPNKDSIDVTETYSGNMLKYRFYHSAKGDIELIYNDFTFGIGAVYNSFMRNIDAAFQGTGTGLPAFLPGLEEYRSTYNSGEVVFDLRLGYQFLKHSQLSLLINNAFNNEYMGRPGDVGAPRNIALKYTLKIN